jgi:hypothetical protein
VADISDVHVVKWANERSRVIADQMTSLLTKLKAYQADYAAQGIAALITAAGGANLVGDGSDLDGRPRISGNQIVNLKAAVDQLITAWTVTQVAGVGATVEAVENQIQVNGSAR